MPSAQVTIVQQDRAAIVPALTGIEIGTVLTADWGPIVPYKITDPSQQPIIYSTPNNKKGSSWNGAQLLASSSTACWMTRAIHDDATYAAALVRFEYTAPNFNVCITPNTYPDTVISPLSAGISLTGLASYEFPLYEQPRVYSDTLETVINTVTNSLTFNVTSFTTPSGALLDAGDLLSFGPSSSMSNSSAYYTIVSAIVTPIIVHTLTLSAPITAPSGTEVLNSSLGHYSPPIYLTADASSTTVVQVTSSDNIVNGQSVSINSTTAVLDQKSLVNETINIITLDSPVSVDGGTEIQLMISNDVVYRDAWLVTAIYPGALGSSIKFGISPSTNYPGVAVILNVYWNGVLKESWEVTRDNFIDEFGNQLNAETKINGFSKYIVVTDNTADLTRSLPLTTTYGVWLQNSSSVFIQAPSITVIENVLTGDQNVTISIQGVMAIGSRIKFSLTGPEYKVLSLTGSTTVTLGLDRPITDTITIGPGSYIYYFSSTYTNTPLCIYNGIQSYFYQQTPVFTNYDIGDQYTISGLVGTIMDAGTNSLGGGSDGSLITLYDVINAFNLMSNKEVYKIACFCDNGFSYPEVAQAIDTIAQQTNLSHGYNSVPYTTELMNAPDQAVIAYRNSLNMNTAFSSLFTGWIQVTDTYNQTLVWVAPSVFGIVSQSFVTRDYYMFTPAAGWVYGIVKGLNINVNYDLGQRNSLIAANINPIRYRVGYGLAIWGNETLYVKPSPLQLRSVAMLLIVLKYGLDTMLDFELFKENNQTEWTSVENTIKLFIKNTLFIPGGLYDYQVSITKIITDSDIDNRRMPIFIGLQPTEDIQLIPVTIGIFNKSVAISF